ncbi:hypothetical protein ERO13_A13G050050v2 [Gossypium hirsutum]|nr:hypothetical protein ERO13_A13G050050v2 [Gossypium hirsutum]
MSDPTITSGPGLGCYMISIFWLAQEEIFGPVLICMEADSLEEAINIFNRNKYGNGAFILNTSGAAARKFPTEIETR